MFFISNIAGGCFPLAFFLISRNIPMNIMEQNIRKAAEDFGFKNEYLQEGRVVGIEEGKETERQILAIKALKKGYPIEEIMDLTGMNRKEILSLKKK